MRMIGFLCELSGVSRSGYYAWIHTVEKRDFREKQDETDI